MIRSARTGIPDDAVNLHASAVVLGDAAVMVTGVAGAGKTHLALGLLDQWHDDGRHARFLADDQVFVVRRGGRVVAHAPQAIAGLAEIRGVGIVKLPYQPVAPVDLVVHLAEDAPVAGSLSTIRIAAVDLPYLSLRCRSSRTSCMSVAAALAAIQSAREAENASIMLARANDLGLPSPDGRTT